MKIFIPLLCSLLFLATPAAAAEQKWIVHEWGTFTALQNDKGEIVAGVNTDDEPVPSFVHDVGNAVARGNSELSPVFETRVRTTKGSVPRLHPDVTMRLETPVIYFYPPKGEKSRKIDVTVHFRGGWLSQFYPKGESNLKPEDPATKRITAETTGALSWIDLEVGVEGEGPTTQDKVWLAPRKVKAATLRNAQGELEKFLFYRGVGNVSGPLTVLRKDGDLWVKGSDAIKQVWRVDVRTDGKIAWRRGKDRYFAPFAPEEYAKDNLKTLRAELHAALKADGLYSDEATAMLDTWDHSYFKAAGERVFYLVPQAWTDKVLPLAISVPSKTVRVMIGRIELLNEAQQLALQRIRMSRLEGVDDFINKGTADRSDWKLFMDVSAGIKPVSALGAAVPDAYKDYLLLGRFRDAVLLDDSVKQPHSAVAEFIKKNDITMHQLP